jgi:hypothetical protein
MRIVRTTPFAYLLAKAKVFDWLVAPHDPWQCVPYIVGVSDDYPALLQSLTLAPRYDRRDQALDDYTRPFVGSPILWHPTFLALGVVAIVILVRRRNVADVVLAAYLGSAIAFSLSFFFIALACDYRYLYSLDVSAIAVWLYLIFGLHGRTGQPVAPERVVGDRGDGRDRKVNAPRRLSTGRWRRAQCKSHQMHYTTSQ